MCDPPLGNVKTTNGAKIIFDGEKGVFLGLGGSAECGEEVAEIGGAGEAESAEG